MSGFVGIFHRDGRPVDAAELEALTASLRFRGPDGTHTWHRGSIGLGHTRFTTHAARDSEPQPLALDERFRIAGHIRLDAREELIAALEGTGARVAPGTQDASLVLFACRAWGEACVQRLHGEFSFAIWDQAEQRLFCARDPFGVRPLFYAPFPDLYIVGNTLKCLRRHPRVGDALDPQAIADFLAHGQALDAQASFFRDLRRLPGGHSLTVTRTAAVVRKYWELPQEPQLRYPRREQYVEHFGEVLSRAVADRAASGPTGLSLSGGLDSAAIAAVAAGRLGRRGLADLRALCCGWNCAFTDPEPSFAKTTASALQLPLEIFEAADAVPFKLADAGPEPQDDFYRAEFVASSARMAREARVNLDGQGGDEVFRSETVLDEARRGNWLVLAQDALQTWKAVRRPPLGLLARLRGTRAIAGSIAGRPVARAKLTSRLWGPYLESFDAGVTGVALDTSWPYLDHRVLGFALALPPMPWCVDKHLARRALAPVLPAAITQRPKSALAGSPLEAFLLSSPGWPLQQRWIAAELGSLLDWERWTQAWERRRGGAWELTRPVALALWLRQNRAAPVTCVPPRPASRAVNSGGARHNPEPLVHETENS